MGGIGAAREGTSRVGFAGLYARLPAKASEQLLNSAQATAGEMFLT